MRRDHRKFRYAFWEGAALLAAVLAIVFSVNGWYAYQEKKALKSLSESWEETEQELGSEAEKSLIEYEGKKYRRNTYVKAILLMGIDRKGTLEENMVTGSGGQADGIFLIAHDTVRDSVRILLIPRDTMTPITLTDLSGNVLGKDIQHLTLAYVYGDGREKSCRYMKEAVTELLGGLGIDGYIALGMEALPVLNDTVGGVTVTIEEEGLAAADPAFVKGEKVLLKGDQAERYVRYRDIKIAQSALTRTERQKTYIAGFVQAAKRKARDEEGVITRLLEEAQPYMVTDLSKGQYMDMALGFLKSSQDFGQEDMVTLPGEAVETNLYDEYYPYQEEILPIVLDFFYREEG